MIEHLDIYPTLIEMCGLVSAPTNLHGESLVRLLEDPVAMWSKPAITQVERTVEGHPSLMGYSVRTERYRYTSWQDGTAGEELYDYQDDPRELKNLASDPTHRRLKFALQVQLNSITTARGKRRSTATLGRSIDLVENAC